MIGDARDAATLRRAAVGRASHLICLAHILDPDLCVLMRSEELASSHRTGSRLDFFSIEEQGARFMLREHSPFPLDDPSLRESNRDQAAHIGSKLAAIR